MYWNVFEFAQKKVAGQSPAKSNREVKLMRVSSTISVTLNLGIRACWFKNKGEEILQFGYAFGAYRAYFLGNILIFLHFSQGFYFFHNEIPKSGDAFGMTQFFRIGEEDRHLYGLNIR